MTILLFLAIFSKKLNFFLDFIVLMVLVWCPACLGWLGGLSSFEFFGKCSGKLVLIYLGLLERQIRAREGRRNNH